MPVGRHKIHMSEDKFGIDFRAVALYIPAAQTVFVTVTSAIIACLSCWLTPIESVSAVRTLAITTGFAVLLIRVPWVPRQVGSTRGKCFALVIHVLYTFLE